MNIFTENDVDEFCSGGFVYLHHKPTQHQTRYPCDNATPQDIESAWAELQDLVENKP